MRTLIFVLSGILMFFVPHSSSFLWQWKCDVNEETCSRVSTSETSNDVLYPSLEVCRLVCGKYGGLWPKPTISTVVTNGLFPFVVSSLKFDIPTDSSSVRYFLEAASALFVKSIEHNNTTNCPVKGNVVTVSFSVSSSDTDLKWNTNENYSVIVTPLSSTTNYVKINSETVFGARHALETLSQLIEPYPNGNHSTCLVVIKDVKIYDKPIYPHRGLLLDTARNFLSVSSIKKQLDAMSYSKMNVLHWHITDSQSFPLELPNLLNMTRYGAYSAEKIYHPYDVEDIVSYAKQRGIRIIMEIDTPSHSGNGWQWGAEAGIGNLAVCVNEQPYRSYCIQPPCGQLNPANPNVYVVLKMLYKDVLDMLPQGELFHMGGDEVFIPCWNSSREIIDYLQNKSRTLNSFLDLWGEFQNKALESFDAVSSVSNVPIILWTSHLTQPEVIEQYLSKERYIIQTWVPQSDPLPKDLLTLGYRIIVSTKDAWYLDHGFWGSTIYHNWRKVYNNRIPTGTNTLGGEVCMWGEYVDDSSIDSRVWPRAAAAAERLWTNPSSYSGEAEKRFNRHRERLVSRGVNAEAVVPKWCYQNEGECS